MIIKGHFSQSKVARWSQPWVNSLNQDRIVRNHGLLCSPFTSEQKVAMMKPTNIIFTRKSRETPYSTAFSHLVESNPWRPSSQLIYHRAGTLHELGLVWWWLQLDCLDNHWKYALASQDLAIEIESQGSRSHEVPLTHPNLIIGCYWPFCFVHP